MLGRMTVVCFWLNLVYWILTVRFTFGRDNYRRVGRCLRRYNLYS